MKLIYALIAVSLILCPLSTEAKESEVCIRCEGRFLITEMSYINQFIEFGECGGLGWWCKECRSGLRYVEEEPYFPYPMKFGKNATDDFIERFYGPGDYPIYYSFDNHKFKVDAPDEKGVHKVTLVREVK